MDQQKRAMLYPPIEPVIRDTDSASGNMQMTYEERNTAAAAIGLPIEAPPSYDMAIGTAPMTPQSTNNSPAGWRVTNTSTAAAAADTPPATRTNAHSRGGGGGGGDGGGRTVPIVAVQPLPHQTPTSAIVQPSVMIATSPALRLGPEPSTVVCPSCSANRPTRVTYMPNTRTHLCAFILCLVGWCCCACCVPYCMNSCRTAHHYCGKCNTFLGTYSTNPRDRLLFGIGK